MKIVIYTEKPEEFIEKIREEITGERVKTWDFTGDNLVHTGGKGQWEDIFLSPGIRKDRISVSAVRSPQQDRGGESYVMGRFVELLLTHLYRDFDKIEIY
ncbi:MAG: hypothetical protein LBJ47_10700 [Tannerella sp.]|jgi:hypothetical protein|nr:hypothetical protein [Tannerella sp.]